MLFCYKEQLKMAITKTDVKGAGIASLHNVRVAPRRARLVADLVRGKKVEQALNLLTTCNRKTAPLLKKLIMSAVANARQNATQDGDPLEVEELYVKRVWVDEGLTLKRFMPRAQGRATPIRKRGSNISVVLDQY